MLRVENGAYLQEAVRDFVRDNLRDEEPRRLHITSQNHGIFIPAENQVCEMKPKGLWYGFNDSWIDWCLTEQPNWLQPYVYEVVLVPDKILRITNEREFEAFEDEYFGVPEYEKTVRAELDSLWPRHYRPRYVSHIEWGRFAEKYHGLEITPYLWDKRLSAMWYYGWDCESGVVWHQDAIAEFRLFAHFDRETRRYERAV